MKEMLFAFRVIRHFELIEERDFKGLKDTGHVGWEDDAVDVPCPTGLEEVDFDMGIVSIHNKKTSISLRYPFPGIGIKNSFQPLLRYEAVRPAALRNLN